LNQTVLFFFICLLLGCVIVGYGEVPVNSDNSVEQTFLAIFCKLLSHNLLTYFVIPLFSFVFGFVYLFIFIGKEDVMFKLA